MDKYSGFAELAQNEKGDVDFTILYREVDFRFAIMAPHGGGIEPGTVDIADSLAGCDYTFYAFKGLKKNGNGVLHINSNLFDEPLALKTSRHADIVIAIHGSKNKEEIVYVGGKHRELKQHLLHSLQSEGFAASISDVPGLMGIGPNNICNRCKTGKGVQLEISRGLRDKLFNRLNNRSLRSKTVLFYQFVNTLKDGLRTFSDAT